MQSQIASSNTQNLAPRNANRENVARTLSLYAMSRLGGI